MVAELIDETILAGPGSALDVQEAAVDLRERWHALADDNRDVIFAGRLIDDAGQRLLLGPYFNVVVAIAESRAAIML